MSVESARDFYNHAWKESRGAADWVIVVNVDELVYHSSPREVLAVSELCTKVRLMALR